MTDHRSTHPTIHTLKIYQQATAWVYHEQRQEGLRQSYIGDVQPLQLHSPHSDAQACCGTKNENRFLLLKGCFSFCKNIILEIKYPQPRPGPSTDLSKSSHTSSQYHARLSSIIISGIWASSMAVAAALFIASSSWHFPAGPPLPAPNASRSPSHSPSSRM